MDRAAVTGGPLWTIEPRRCRAAAFPESAIRDGAQHLEMRSVCDAGHRENQRRIQIAAGSSDQGCTQTLHPCTCKKGGLVARLDGVSGWRPDTGLCLWDVLRLGLMLERGLYDAELFEERSRVTKAKVSVTQGGQSVLLLAKFEASLGTPKKY